LKGSAADDTSRGAAAEPDGSPPRAPLYEPVALRADGRPGALADGALIDGALVPAAAAVAELLELLTRERAARAAAEAALRAQDEFLRVAAHDLRTPLTSLKGYAQLACRLHARGQLDPDRLAHTLKCIELSTNQLNALIADLIDVSRLRTGRLVLRREPVDLASLVRAVVGACHETIGEGPAVAAEVVAEPCVVVGDAERLAHALRLLLKYMLERAHAGSEVRVRLRPSDAGAVLRIQARTMGPFVDAAGQRADTTDGAVGAPDSQAAGPDLYVSRVIVEAHGGCLFVQSVGQSVDDSAGDGHSPALVVTLPGAGPAASSSTGV
jgi:signal transduction histidine kinase